MQMETFHNLARKGIGVENLMKYIQNIGNFVEVTFKTHNLFHISQLLCLKNKILPTKTLKNMFL
jgi:hypothetical protein